MSAPRHLPYDDPSCTITVRRFPFASQPQPPHVHPFFSMPRPAATRRAPPQPVDQPHFHHYHPRTQSVTTARTDTHLLT